MPEPAKPDDAEGWDVHGWSGVGLAAALYVLAAIGLGGAAALFALEGPGRMPRPAPRRFPSPQLNVRLDRDPNWSFAPRRSAPAHIDAAMAALAAKGDAGWDVGVHGATKLGRPGS